MKKYLSQLRPLERRLVVGVGVALIVVLNWAFIWPRLSDWNTNQARVNNANATLAKYNAAVAQTKDLESQLKKYESEGEFVPVDDQAVNFMRTVQAQAAQSGVSLQNSSRPTTKTNDVFFVEQTQTINVLAPEDQLVDFLYKLGAGNSMIRIRDLALQPDPPHMRLGADIKLVASYQKNPTGSAAKTSTAKAK